MTKYALGIDYGTESARTVLVAIETGEILASANSAYKDGVISKNLPGSTQKLPKEWALQNPSDWLTILKETIPAVMKQSGVNPVDVIGLGLDFTACSILPTTLDGTPLCKLETYQQERHAWPKLWKHHASQPQADRLNELASIRSEPWLARYGGKISAEWLIPKALQMLEEAPALYNEAAYFVEGGDWVVWQLTGKLTRNACAAGYKGIWHKHDGFPSPDFLAMLYPDLENLYKTKMAGPIVPPGTYVGNLTPAWATALGLTPDTAVAAAIVDAHAAVPGGGVSEPGVMFMMMGTSTCHLVMTEREVAVEGISGVVEDGIMPGWFGYEAGQASVGDMFAWFLENNVPHRYYQEAEERNISLHDLLSEKAAQIRPGQSGLLALDWWNGCRSTLVDGHLSGLIMGYTLSTKPEELYRALIEATAFGTRTIIEAFTKQGVSIKSIVAGGGLTQNALLMQIYADVTGREIDIAGTEQASALGAAILGAVGAGAERGGYESISQATQKMAPGPIKIYRPTSGHLSTYNTLYTEYHRLYDYLGRERKDLMHTLRRLKGLATTISFFENKDRIARLKAKMKDKLDKL